MANIKFLAFWHTQNSSLFGRILAGWIPNCADYTTHNTDGNPVATDEMKASIVQEWYIKKFNGKDPPLEPFVGPPKPLSVPISSLEVEIAAKKLKNGKATGPDNTPNELLKYACDSLYSIYAKTINRCFEENSFIASIGQCYITPKTT